MCLLFLLNARWELKAPKEAEQGKSVRGRLNSALLKPSQVLKSAHPVFLAQIKALSTDWEERHQQLKVEQEKVTELEAQIKLLNTKQEEAMASLQADVLRAASQIQQKEGLAERLRREVAFLEKRVRAACQEAAESAAGLEKGAHEARLALEATLASLCPQLDKEEVIRQSLQSELETPPPQHSEPFLGGRDTEWPGKAEGAEAAAEEALQGQPQEVEGGLQEEVSSAWKDLALGLTVLVLEDNSVAGGGGPLLRTGSRDVGRRGTLGHNCSSFLAAALDKAELARGHLDELKLPLQPVLEEGEAGPSHLSEARSFASTGL